jgi:hypothetical protein
MGPGLPKSASDLNFVPQTSPKAPALPSANVSSRQREFDLQRAIFRDAHGRRLHGFTLLVALGDQEWATRAAAEALNEGARRAADLQHPERAAAWLRASALKSLSGWTPQRSYTSDRTRRGVLRGMGVANAVYDGLAALSVRERAALIATSVERFEPLDVETILGRSNGASRRLVARARQGYLAKVTTSAAFTDIGPVPGGALAEMVRQGAERAMGGAEGES